MTLQHIEGLPFLLINCRKFLMAFWFVHTTYT